MNPRLALYELAQRHGLDARCLDQLFVAAGLQAEPSAVRRWLWPAVTVLGAALGGLGVILWIAANWDTLGRMGRFALLMSLVVVMALGAAWRPRWRPALALMALLGIGALFAYFGQTYQTGADAWQLFALWGVLALPLCLGTRSDVVWAPWALVVTTGISLWTLAHTGHRWRVDPQDLQAHGFGWAAQGALLLVLSPMLARVTGAGAWALRTAATLAVISLSFSALWALFDDRVAPQFMLGLLLLAVAAAALALKPLFDVFALSAVALGLNTLLVAGLARWVFHGARGDPIGRLLFVGFAAAGLLAASVSLILRLAQRHAASESPVAAPQEVA